MNLNIDKCKCNYKEFIIAGRSVTRAIIICDCKCGTSKYELIEFIPKPHNTYATIIRLTPPYKESKPEKPKVKK